MKSTWGPNIYDTAVCNAAQVEEISLLDFEQMLVDDVDVVEWDNLKDDSWLNDDDFELVL